MPDLRGLTIIVATADPQRFAAAVSLASAQAALGGRARIYCHGAAVTLLAPSDAIVTATQLGVSFTACQTGLSDHGLPLPGDVEAGGPISLLAELDDDRVVTF